MPRQSLHTASLITLAVIAAFTALHIAKDVFAPVIAALLLSVVLTPLTDFWNRLRLPDALAALLSVTLALGVLLVLTLLVEPYVTETIRKAPVIWSELRETVESVQRMLRGVQQMTEDVAAAIEPDTTASPGEGSGVALPSVTDALFLAPQFAMQIMVFTGTLYFFLMTQNSIYRWVGRSFDRLGEEELRNAGEQVARYVLTITTINFGFGVAVAIAMHVLGVPSPILWGVLAFSCNFVLYLGPIAVATALLVTGIVVFDGPTSFVPAAVYLSMNAMESQFVTPTMIGKSLSVTPLMVFLSLVFWLWFWGPIGGVIAIPLLIWCLAIYQGITGQTISSGTPGRFLANSSAGAVK
ncbi:MAG: AI-2E family transporter [Pseudomonadota bacterium]